MINDDSKNQNNAAETPIEEPVTDAENTVIEEIQVPEPEIEPGVESEETAEEVRTDAKSDGIETEEVIEESKDALEEKSNDKGESLGADSEEKSEEVATSADQPLSEPGESDPNAQALTSVTSDEPVTEGQASLAGENGDSEQKTETTTTDEPAEDIKPSNPNEKWYVVHTYSGHENKVASAIRQRVESEHLEHKIIDILVPTQDKIEIKAGKKESIKEKIFPGYILVKMVLDDVSWLAVRTTQGVTSFVGIGNKPTPIPESEVRTIVKFMTQGATSTFKDVYSVNDTIKIVDGPFSDFIGKVDTVDKEKGKVRVLVSIFGRETPVELDFLQVQKL